MMWDFWTSPSLPLLPWEWLRPQEPESWKLEAKSSPSTSSSCKHPLVSKPTLITHQTSMILIFMILLNLYGYASLFGSVWRLNVFAIGAGTLLLRGPKDREAKKHFGAPPGVPGSHTKPFVRSKGRKFEQGKNIWRGRDPRCVLLYITHRPIKEFVCRKH